MIGALSGRASATPRLLRPCAHGGLRVAAAPWKPISRARDATAHGCEQPSSSSSSSSSFGRAAALASILLLCPATVGPSCAGEFFDPYGVAERYYFRAPPPQPTPTSAQRSAPALDAAAAAEEEQEAAADDDLSLEEFMGVFAITLGGYVLVMTLVSALLLALGLVDEDDEDESEVAEAGGVVGRRATAALSASAATALRGPGGLDDLLTADPWEEEEEEEEWGDEWGLGRGDPALAFFEATGSLRPPVDPATALRRRAARRAAAYVARTVDRARTGLQAKVLARRLGGEAVAAAVAATATEAAAAAAAAAATEAAATSEQQERRQQRAPSVVRDPSHLDALVDAQLALVGQRELLAPGGDAEAVRRVLSGVAARLALDEAVLMVQRTGEAAEALQRAAEGGDGGGWGAGEAVAAARRRGGGKSPLPSS
jgi:hypothetical protein